MRAFVSTLVAALIAALFAIGLMSLTARAEAPAESASGAQATGGQDDGEYPKEIVMWHERVKTGFPEYDRVGWAELIPCFDRPDRPYCLLHAMAQGGEARDLRWDLRFFGHRAVLNHAGVTAEAGAQLALPQDLVNSAVWRALEAAEPGAAPDQALRAVREIRVNYSAVDLLVPEPKASDLRIEAYNALARLANDDAPPSADVQARARRLEAAVLKALVAECGARKGAKPDGKCDPDDLAIRLIARDQPEQARVVEQSAMRPPAQTAFHIALTQAMADLQAGRLDAAAADAFVPELETTAADNRIDVGILRQDLIEAAVKAGRRDLALSMARRLLAERFPVGGVEADIWGLHTVIGVIEQWGDKEEIAGLAERFDRLAQPTADATSISGHLDIAFAMWRRVGRDDRAGALVDAWTPWAKAHAADTYGSDSAQTVRRLQLALGRTDLVPEAPSREKPAEVLGQAMARLGPDDPGVRAELATVTPARRTAAYYSCAYAAATTDRTMFAACLDRFDPAVSPRDKTEDMAYLAFQTAAADTRADKAWRTRTLMAAARLARATKSGPHDMQLIFDYEMLRDFAIRELEEAGQF
jgi:hypothetical protein